jgi:NAD(P)H-dependent FMN reductase
VSKLHVIIGSTRPGRAADLVAPWVIDRTQKHGGFDVEVLDLREWALPMFAETYETVGDFNDPTYSSPVVRSWNHKIAEADAFLVITPEYNHSVPAVLKNAIDSVFVSFAFRNKPVAVVGYPVADISLRIALDDLKWWSVALETARAEGQLPPSAFRVQAAAAAVDEVEDEAV